MRPHRSRLQPGEAYELQLEIEWLHHALNGFEDCRKRTPRHVLAGELPQDLRCQELAKPMCYLMDPLHMLAYRPRAGAGECACQVGDAAHSPSAETPPAQPPDTRMGHLSTLQIRAPEL